MHPDIIFAFNVFGTKEIIVYIIVIVAIVAVALYMRRGAMSRVVARYCRSSRATTAPRPC